jgi:hypothetical protein
MAQPPQPATQQALEDIASAFMQQQELEAIADEFVQKQEQQQQLEDVASAFLERYELLQGDHVPIDQPPGGFEPSDQ